jgi:hypothetical protein
MKSLAQQFVEDRQGRRYADVVNEARISFFDILAFFEDPQRQRRLIESELHHDRPALAGVICELEHRPDMERFFLTYAGPVTIRLRQAIGVLVRIIMESHGFKTTGRKGSLGVRQQAPTPKTRAGAYHNTGGLSLWFIRAERYELAAGMPYRPVAQRAAEIAAPQKPKRRVAKNR